MNLNRLSDIFTRRPDPPAPTAAGDVSGWQEAREERAAIMEYDGGLTRADAETAAAGLHPDPEGNWNE